MEKAFWVLLVLIFYTYLGYGLVLYIFVRIKRVLKKEKVRNLSADFPAITLLVAAYNERDCIHWKIGNSKELDYPVEKIRQLWVTDGSDDGSEQELMLYPEVKVLHQAQRRGKVAAINRAMEFVDTPIVIFSDANTLLSRESVRKIVELFNDTEIGCVSGEKRILVAADDAAASAGEGFYWKYESLLKKWDSELNSVVGAAGELFAIRTSLYKTVPEDTLLDDFYISLKIALDGYKIKYAPEAYASERSSANVKEELKRKIRISAGGFQSMIRLYPLFNVFKFPLLSFQYVSHRVLRWALAPLSLPVLLFLNMLLVNKGAFFIILLAAQIIFYLTALVGGIFQNRKIRVKGLFIPYFFFIMNYAVYMGFRRYISGKQSVKWERAQRAS